MLTTWWTKINQVPAVCHLQLVLITTSLAAPSPTTDKIILVGRDFILSGLTFLLAFNSRRSIGVFAWGDSGTLRLVKGQ